MELKIVFQEFDEDTGRPKDVTTSSVLYVADITDDMILSYTWLGSRNFAVYPRQHGLKGRQGSTRVWVPGTPSERVQGVCAHPTQPEVVGEGGLKKALVLLPVKEGVMEALERQGFEIKTISMSGAGQPTIPVGFFDWNFAEKYPSGYFQVMIAAPLDATKVRGWAVDRFSDGDVITQIFRGC